MQKTITCPNCGKAQPLSEYIKLRDPTLFPTGYAPLCASCYKKDLVAHDFELERVDRLLQYFGIPFLPKEWINTRKSYKDDALLYYCKFYSQKKFPYLDWKSAYLKYKELSDKGLLETAMPNYTEAELNDLRQKWGMHYTEPSELYQLEHLYNGILNTYGITGEKQIDDVKKVCRISLQIDDRMRAGEDISKLIKSYDDLCKMANLAPKNVKDAADFSSMGEVFAYLEKTGYTNSFYDGAERDIVDKTMKDMQNWSRNLYVNESSIPEDIANKIQALKMANDMEDEMNAIQDDGLDTFDMEQTFLEEFDEGAGL